MSKAKTTVLGLISSSNVDKITSARDLLSMDPVTVDQAHLIICPLTSTAAAAAAAVVRGLSFPSLSNIYVYIYIYIHIKKNKVKSDPSILIL